MTIAHYIKDGWKGMFIIGDVHGDYELFKMAVKYANEHNLFLLSAGDLVDRGRHPFEVVRHMHGLMRVGKAGFVIGNHDDKYRRYHYGAKVNFSHDAKQTLSDVGAERKAEFLKMYSEINDHPSLAGMFHVFDDIAVAHAASHPSIWDSSITFTSEARSRCLFGEVNGERDEEGFPVRLYNWIEEIPAGKTIIVGHDRTPVFNKVIYEPLIRVNANGGKAIFIDTGCGKGGFLTGIVVTHDESGFAVGKHVDFNLGVKISPAADWTVEEEEAFNNLDVKA